MRLVFLFFLLMNVIYFAWQYTQPTQTGQVLPVVDPGLTKLLLAGEGSLEAAKKSPKPKVLRVEAERETIIDTSVKRKSSGNQCYAIGIIQDKKDAEAIRAQLKKTGRLAKIMGFKGTTYLYWVYLPSHQTIEKANQVTDDLKEKGLKDYQVLTIEGKKNAISLGIFKFKSTALLRIKHLNRLGYDPIIGIKRSKSSKSRQYKVIYPVKTGKPLSKAEWRAIQVEHLGLDMREEACK